MIYFDNASTTRCSEQAAEILIKYSSELYFNPSSAYPEGISVKNDLERARSRILRALRAPEGKLVFTSSGTESDNMALFGTRKPNGSRVIISAAEHAAIYNSAMELKKRGYDVRLCPVDIGGKVDYEAFCGLLTPDTSLVSIIHANNETGGINDIKALCAAAKRVNPDVIFHSDGVQAFGKIEVDLTDSGIDLYSISGHKINAPKGVAALYIRKGLNISPIIFGGGQENGLRSSTENTGAVVAFAEMAAYFAENRKKLTENAATIKNKIASALSEIEEIKFVSGTDSSDYILTFSSSKVRGEVMQHALERLGILIGTGSACSSTRASKRVAEAIGLKDKYLDGVMRISFGIYNTPEEADEFINAFFTKYKELSVYGS